MSWKLKKVFETDQNVDDPLPRVEAIGTVLCNLPILHQIM